MTEAHRPANHGLDREKLDSVVGPIVRAHGAEVVDVEFKGDRAGWVLRIFVEKLGSDEQKLSTEAAAVDLDVCSGIARELSTALDVVDVVAHSYHLEISSPGVERTLRGERDYLRFVGKKAKLKLHGAIKGQKVLTGVLGPVREHHLSLEDGGQTFDIALADIASAHLVFEFGPAPRPGKKAGKKKAPKG